MAVRERSASEVWGQKDGGALARLSHPVESTKGTGPRAWELSKAGKNV